jgi:hypothetical protein
VDDDELDVRRFARLGRDGRTAGEAGNWRLASRQLHDALALWRG